MRVYGRTGQTNGFGGTWTVVETDANGFNDGVYFTALIQALKLNLGESPFWGNSGIPTMQSIIMQVAPDVYVARVQKQYAPYFASLTIQRVQTASSADPPTYYAKAVCHTGAILSTTVAT